MSQFKRAIHKKTGNIYHVLNDNVIECTNGREDIRYVVYYREGKTFCREYNEFIKKFDYECSENNIS